MVNFTIAECCLSCKYFNPNDWESFGICKKVNEDINQVCICSEYKRVNNNKLRELKEDYIYAI